MKVLPTPRFALFSYSKFIPSIFKSLLACVTGSVATSIAVRISALSSVRQALSRSFKGVLTVLFAAIVAISSSLAAAATEANDYFIKVDVTGSRIPLKLIKSNIPFNKNYVNFNNIDKATYRSYYENIPADNVPPFPKDGLGQIAKDVKDGHSKMQKAGALFVVANVDRAGKIEKISVFDSPDERMSQLVSAAIWEEEFAPGNCAGQPCAMEFVLDWELLPMRGNAVVDSDKRSRNSRKRSD